MKSDKNRRGKIPQVSRRKNGKSPMADDRMHPIIPKRGPAECPYCKVILTKSEVTGAACPSCRKPFADESEEEVDPNACPKCRGPITQKRVECVVCGKCGELGPKWGDGTFKCPKCRETYQRMELPASVCESCGWMRINQRAVRLRWFWQLLAAVVFGGTVMLPAVEYWSPKGSVWVFKKYGITVPIIAWLIVAAAGGAIAAAIATPQRRLRKIGAICGIFGGLGGFGLSWGYLLLMVRFQRESVFHNEIILMTILGAAPAYFLYDVLERRQRKAAKRRNQTIKV